MTSPPHGLYLPRRDSSPRPQGGRSSSSSSRRPRLLRACATEPSITTSSACKGVMTSPNSSRRATELLSRVAVSNAAASTMLGSSPSSTRSFGTDSSGRANSHLDEAAHRELLHGRDYSACYFSFPSFDAWEGEQPEGEKSYDASV